MFICIRSGDMVEENMNLDSCSCTVIHEEIIERAGKMMPREGVLNELAELFKVFGDPTRIKILHALFVSEMCVCDIAALLEMNQSAISHQLRILKQARLVKYRRDGKVVYYSLDDQHIMEIFDRGLAHVNEK
jgi:ArsR family transcriptional regulator